MSEYRIFETDQFAGDLRRLARDGHAKVAAKLRHVVYPALRAHPHFGPHIRRLKGYEPPTWRCRIGAWRFFYEVDETERVVAMIAATHRGSAYRP